RSAASYRPGEAPGGDANGGKDAERRPKALVVGHRLVDGVPERAQLQVSEPFVRCAERSMTKPGPPVAEGRAELDPPLQAIRRGPRPEERALVVVVEAAVLPPGVEGPVHERERLGRHKAARLHLGGQRAVDGRAIAARARQRFACDRQERRCPGCRCRAGAEQAHSTSIGNAAESGRSATFKRKVMSQRPGMKKTRPST